jgi:CSLREA domain-containing protein
MAVIVPVTVLVLAIDLAAAGASAPWHAAGPASLVVNTTSDSDDGACDATHCSLREAMTVAYSNPGPDTISFNIPPNDPGCNAAGVCTIHPATYLPLVTDAETAIDGFSQPGALPNSSPSGQGINAVYKIVLDGSAVPCCHAAVEFRSSGNLVRGLVIQRFYYGVFVLDADDNRIEGNFIGTDAQGASTAGNLCVGVSINSTEGGPASHNNVLGGSSPQARNLISGNGCAGVEIGPGGNNKVQGNIIGADASGTLPLLNVGDGVYVFNATNNNVIGGEAAGEANLIAFNGEYGVEVSGGYGASGNTITRNRIHSNVDRGIALLGGGNAGLAAPEITVAMASYVSGKACAGCTIEVFSDENGEGAVYEGTTTAGENGTWSLGEPGGVAGPNLTATATDGTGNTSEFSAPASLQTHKAYLPLLLK